MQNIPKSNKKGTRQMCESKFLQICSFSIFSALWVYHFHCYSMSFPPLYLTLSRRKPLSYRNQSIDLLCKSMDWFLYDNGLRLERVKLPPWFPVSRPWPFLAFPPILAAFPYSVPLFPIFDFTDSLLSL